MFRFFISKFNYKTPGRDDAEQKTTTVSNSELPFSVLEAMGGQNNIKHLDACITRLRVEVLDKTKVDKSELRSLGASGVLEVGNNIQAIFGPKSDQIKHDMARIISGEITKPSETTVTEEGNQENAEILAEGDATIYSPINGEIIYISEVPDKVFSEKMMGDGIAIIPETGEVVAPFDGKLKMTFPTKHAIGLESTEGVELLIHFGLETVKLEGQGFEILAEAETDIIKGQPLMKVDLDYIKEHADSTVTPIVVTNLNDSKLETLVKGKVEQGDKIFIVK